MKGASVRGFHHFWRWKNEKESCDTSEKNTPTAATGILETYCFIHIYILMLPSSLSWEPKAVYRYRKTDIKCKDDSSNYSCQAIQSSQQGYGRINIYNTVLPQSQSVPPNTPQCAYVTFGLHRHVMLISGIPPFGGVLPTCWLAGQRQRSRGWKQDTAASLLPVLYLCFMLFTFHGMDEDSSSPYSLLLASCWI